MAVEVGRSAVRREKGVRRGADEKGRQKSNKNNRKTRKTTIIIIIKNNIKVLKTKLE